MARTSSLSLVARALGDVGVVVADHAYARGRGGDHHLAVREHRHEPAYERHGLVRVTAVEVHLPAAGLLARKVDLHAEALQEADRRLPGLREQGVVEAGDEEGGLHRRVASSRPRCGAVATAGKLAISRQTRRSSGSRYLHR